MPRYYLVSKYKCINSVKNIKELHINNTLFVKKLGAIIKQVKNSHCKDILTNVKNNISLKIIPESCKTLCGGQPVTEQNKYDVQDKFIKPKYLKRDVQKLFANLQKTVVKNKVLLYSAIPVVATNSNEKIVDPIPEPPAIPEGSEEILNQLNAIGEPTFASLGLGGNSPVGFVQWCLEYLHVTLNVEWWAAIVIGTLIIRLCMFPLVIIAQRNAARMNNYLPQMQTLQLKMTEARQTGNQLDASRYSQELMLFMKEKNLNPLKNMIVPLAQMPIFVSFFMGLRGMSNVPVESLRTGGLFWFTDLTLPDQYFLLPIITSVTLLATIELGTDSAKLSSQNLALMKYVLRALPLVVLPFTINFPGAILCYWVSSNFVSLLQVGLLRIPKVRDYFKIEPLVSFKPENLPVKPKGFMEGLNDSWTNMKITKELEERSRLDEVQFRRAGKGPIVKTYKYDPTKQVDATKSAPISAKKR